MFPISDSDLTRRTRPIVNLSIIGLCAAVFVFFVRIPAFCLLGFWFLLQFFSGLGSLGPSSQTGGVAYWAHVGGFVLGIAVVIVYKLVTGQGIWPRGPQGGARIEADMPQYEPGRWF